MPSDPFQVIHLAMSPRLAKLVKSAALGQEVDHSVEEADLLEAVAAEIDAQLGSAPRRPTSETVAKELSPAEQIAGKMAKASRDAAEGQT